MMLAAAVLALAVLLTVAGLMLGSDWSTFLPDMVVGLAGAGLISLVVAVVQQRATEHADRRRSQEAAYLDLLDGVTELRQFRPDADAENILARLTTKMIVFAELVERDYPSLPRWFEAERQMVLNNVHIAMERWPETGVDATLQDQYRALEPIFRWTKDFSSNVRRWRTGRLADSEVAEQAALIERLLRAAGRWQDVR